MSRSVRLVMAALACLLSLGGALPDPVAASHDDEVRIRPDLLDDLPYRGVVILGIADRIRCSGFLVRRDAVVTAAHCLVRDAVGGDFRLIRDVATRTVAVAGYSAGKSPYGLCSVASVWVNPGYVRSGPNDPHVGQGHSDYAVLTLGCRYAADQVIGLRTTSCGDGRLPTGARLTTIGYPHAPRYAPRMDADHLWATTGHVEGCTDRPRSLDFSDFVAPGMSGGPALIRRAQDASCGRPHCAVAIVTRGALARGGEGVRITPAVAADLRSH